MLRPLISDTAIKSAAILGDMEWFIKRHNTDQLKPMLKETHDGWYPHEIVAMHGHAKVLQLLIENYGDLLHSLSSCSKIMSIAAIHNKLGVLQYLLTVCPMRLRPEDGSVMQFAANYGFIDLIRFLVEDYSAPFDITEHDNYVLCTAITRKHHSLIKYLVVEVPRHRQQYVDLGKIPQPLWDRLYPQITKTEMLHKLHKLYGSEASHAA